MNTWIMVILRGFKLQPWRPARRPPGRGRGAGERQNRGAGPGGKTGARVRGPQGAPSAPVLLVCPQCPPAPLRGRSPAGVPWWLPALLGLCGRALGPPAPTAPVLPPGPYCPGFAFPRPLLPPPGRPLCRPPGLLRLHL